MTPATLLRELRAAGVVLRVRGGRLEAKHLPPHLSALTKAHAAELRRLLAEPVDAWRLDLATWPGWRRDVFEERAAIREHDGQQPRDLAEWCAYLEAVEAPEEAPPSTAPPANDTAPDLEELAAGAPALALLLEAFPGARVEVRPRRSPAVDLEEPESVDPAESEAPPGFRHRYQPPPERVTLPPFRWSVPLPPARRADAPAYRKPPPPAPAGPPTPLHSLCDPHEPPERRAARFGYRIDAFGAWVEEGKASVAPHLARFAVGHEPSAAELEAHHAQLAAIEGYCIARLGPLRGASPLPEPSPDVLPERADVWRAAYRRRLATGIDPESAARLTITTHGPCPGGIA